jgi:hypothetical protein
MFFPTVGASGMPEVTKPAHILYYRTLIDNGGEMIHTYFIRCPRCQDFRTL